MKSKKLRISILVILLSLVACAAFAVTAGAEESTVTPEIISQNIAYEGDFALMYAVAADSVAEGKVFLSLYHDAPSAESTADRVYVAEAPTSIKISGVEVQAYVFKTEGVSAKDMADVFYVQATDAKGNKSAIKSYSVAEYLYERLYACNDVTAKQRALYESALIFGANAQAILAEGETPVTDYVYYNVTEGNIGGKAQGIVKKNVATAVTYNGTATNQIGWRITYASGEEITVNGNSVTLTESAAISPHLKNMATFEDGSFAGPFYNSYLYGTNAEGSVVRVTADEAALLTGTPAPITAYSIESNIGGRTGKVLKVSCTKKTDATNGYQAGQTIVNVSNDDPTGSTFVFEADFYMESSASSSDVTQIHFQGSGNTVATYRLNYQSGKKGLEMYQDNGDGSGKHIFTNAFVPAGEWVTIRIEFYQTMNAETTMSKIYLGTEGNEPVCVCDAVTYRNAGLSKVMDSVNIAHQRTNTTVTYWDNLSLSQIDKAYEPLTVCATDFENEELTYDANYPEIVAGVGPYVKNEMPTAIQSGGTGTPADYRTYKIVEDPYDAANKVLEAYTYFGGGDNVASTSKSTFVDLQVDGVCGDCYVFEARLCYTSGSGSLTQVFFRDYAGTSLYGFLLSGSTVDGENKIIINEQNEKDGTGGNAVIYDKGLPFGEWFTLRVEFYWVGDKVTPPVARFYVNGEFILEDTTYRNAALKSTGNLPEVQIMHQRNKTHTLLIDDLVYYNCNKALPVEPDTAE